MEIPSFYKSIPKIMIIWYTVPEIRRVTDVNFVFHFGLVFDLLPPNKPKNQNKKKALGDIAILHMRSKNHDHMVYGSWDMVPDGCTDRSTDGQTDRKNHI